ncbi:MAG: hypothetical protein HOC71_03780 [Candidatus Latescibacteria bacterium]|nr:hypothetical protein [Candidatus Latescibacterota bacterium]
MNVTALFYITSCLSDPSYNFITEDIDFEEIFSDIPENFDSRNATVSEFLKLPFFTAEAARTIVIFRDSVKTDETFLAHLEEIRELTPLQLAVLNYLKPVSAPSFRPEYSGFFRNGIVHRPDEEAVSDGKYYFKLLSQWGDVCHAAILGERDPFESRALDLISANLSLSSDKKRIKIIMGDYRPGYGQGLVFSRYGRSYIYGTDIDVRETKNAANTFFEESLYLRGCHVTMHRKWFDTYVWTSLRNRDATLDENGKAITIKESGYHYAGEARENLSEKISAVRLAMTRIPGVEWSVTGIVTRYSPELAHKQGENSFHDPEGKTFKHVTFDGRLERGSTTVFFEHAVMESNENATISGILIKKPRFRTGIHFRHYDKGFWAPRSGGFSAFGRTFNEKGVYSGISADLSKTIRLTASMDLARSLYRTYFENMPFSRKRINIALQSRLFNGIRGRITARMTDNSGPQSGDEEKSVKRRWNSRIKFENSHGRSSVWGWRTTAVWSDSQMEDDEKNGNDGGPFTEIGISFSRNDLKLDMATAFYNIPSYASRYYRYERNVPGRGRTSAVWGRGKSIIFLFRWKSISLRYRHNNSDIMELSNEISFQCDADF